MFVRCIAYTSYIAIAPSVCPLGAEAKWVLRLKACGSLRTSASERAVSPKPSRISGSTSKRVFSRQATTHLDPTCSSRSEEHTSELQSRRDLVCRLLLEKKKKN